MNLINDDDLRRKPKVSEHHIPCLQGGHEHLVDGAHNEAGEKPLLGTAEPIVTCEGCVRRKRLFVVSVFRVKLLIKSLYVSEFLIRFVESVLGVAQEHGMGLYGFTVFLCHIICLVFHPFGNTVKEGIRSRLGRCREGHTRATGRLRKELGSDETGFSLTLTHGRFDAHHAATLHGACRFNNDFLHGVQGRVAPPKTGRVEISCRGVGAGIQRGSPALFKPERLPTNARSLFLLG